MLRVEMCKRAFRASQKARRGYTLCPANRSEPRGLAERWNRTGHKIPIRAVLFCIYPHSVPKTFDGDLVTSRIQVVWPPPQKWGYF